jgi:hypothetical protein
MQTIAEDGIFNDYSNTGQVSLILPAGVTFTSASGQFLSTPEPSAWPVLGLCLAALVLVSRKRLRSRAAR